MSVNSSPLKEEEKDWKSEVNQDLMRGIHINENRRYAHPLTFLLSLKGPSLPFFFLGYPTAFKQNSEEMEFLCFVVMRRNGSRLVAWLFYLIIYNGVISYMSKDKCN